MENQDYVCYEVKLNRLFGAYAKQNLINLAATLILSVVCIIIYLIFGISEILGFLLFCGLDLVIIGIKLLCNPKSFDVTRRTIKFDQRERYWYASRRYSRSTHQKETYVVTYTMYNIKCIEYLQTPWEKAFSCGHIRILGDINNPENGEKEQRTFTIHGVKDFKNTAEWMKGYIQLSLDT